jgi:hypothetical protein
MYVYYLFVDCESSHFDSLLLYKLASDNMRNTRRGDGFRLDEMGRRGKEDFLSCHRRRNALGNLT